MNFLVGRLMYPLNSINMLTHVNKIYYLVAFSLATIKLSQQERFYCQ